MYAYTDPQQVILKMNWGYRENTSGRQERSAFGMAKSKIYFKVSSEKKPREQLRQECHNLVFSTGHLVSHLPLIPVSTCLLQQCVVYHKHDFKVLNLKSRSASLFSVHLSVYCIQFDYKTILQGLMMREFFLKTLQEPSSLENSRNIIRVLNSLFVEDFRQIMTTAAEKEIVRKALFEPRRIDLIDAMRNRIVRLGSPDLPGLFSEFERENQSQETGRLAQQPAHDVGDMQSMGSMILSCDVAAKTPHINQLWTVDEKRVLSFVDSDHSDTSFSPLREGMVQIFVGHRNVDVPVSLYLDFLRSCLEKEGHPSARNMFALLQFSENGGAKPFFHLCVDKADEAAIFALSNRFFVVAERARKIAEKRAAREESPVHFILTDVSTRIETVSQKCPPDRVVFSTTFQVKRAQLVDDAAALPVYPPHHHHSMPNVQRLAPSPLPYAGVDLFQQPGFHNGNAGLPARVGMFSGPVYPAFVPDSRIVAPSTLAVVQQPLRYPAGGRVGVGMFSQPGRGSIGRGRATRETEGGRKIIPVDAEKVPQPSFMLPQGHPVVPPQLPPSDPLVAAMRGMKPS